MKKSYNYKKGGQMMKKVINVFLTIIMACVVVLLVISLSIRTISTKTISNAFFEEEVSNNMKEVLANTFPDVSSENIDVLENVIKDNEAINEVANDLLNHISDSISSGNKVDSETILNEISVAIDQNVPVIEEALGKDIPEEQIKEIQNKLTDEDSNLKNQIDQTVDKIENMDSSAKQVIKTYDALNNNVTKILCIISLVVIIVLLGIINKSFFKWSLFSGISLIVSGVIVGVIVPMIVNVVEVAIGQRILGTTIDIAVNSLNIAGIICAVIGIVLIIVYAILNRRYRTYDRQYY
ncbi:hypothetical protein CLOSPI_02263 [Thomasclavelia spiroformis DSM 1552]|uniref:Uncharacterized protein n=3 Tax=Thomasclavelia spiroformis TaxID=29348 RepID=B1C594_9FIRM|nr:hypothetical protein CLOSPI_02263 [Thomasclavelia spiroformis DSM 1552]